ncbi:MAG: NTP transferase domain-containing protein [Defluviitaleaceae bacterium]|nr:NTP transferase domain-containing protein [Defluviitaleaceae bacterium]
MKPTIVVMAAGMGSRFGGLKQLSPVGPSGENLMDYSVYDAFAAGFGKVVFVVKRETEQAFRDAYGSKLERVADVRYVFQEIENVPNGVSVPPGRAKPWGTAHAVLSAKGAVTEPFAVINADDFYGAGSFRALRDFLAAPPERAREKHRYAMMGFALSNTLSDGGSVSRGICRRDADGRLIEIIERTRVERRDGAPCYSEDGQSFVPIDEDAVVSMNMWGFNPSIFNEIERKFAEFFERNQARLDTAEMYLPTVVDALIKEGRADVSVLDTADRWWGLTNPGDLQAVREAIAGMVADGKYPEDLWGIVS